MDGDLARTPRPQPRNAAAANHRKPRACLECSRRKVKCERVDGEKVCLECQKRATPCVPRTHPPQKPCESCRRAHLGCEWPGHGPCAHCARATSPSECSLARSTPASGTSNSGPPSPSPSPTTPRPPFFDVVLLKTPAPP